MRPLKDLLPQAVFKQAIQKTLLVSSLALLAACGSETDIGIDPNALPAGFAYNAGVEAEFRANKTYGTDERNVFDIFLPESESATPLVIFVHGGGYYTGDKSEAYSDSRKADINQILDAGVAFATINYSLLDVPGLNGAAANDTVGIMKSLSDVKEALQYLRLNAENFNVNPDKIAMYGTSAGGSASIWLAVTDDMADTEAAEGSLASVSTLIQAAGTIEAQASLDVVRWETEILQGVVPPPYRAPGSPIESGDISLEFAATLSLSLMESFFAIPATAGETTAGTASLVLIRAATGDIADLRATLDFPELMDATDPAIFVQSTLESQTALLTDLSTLFTNALQIPTLQQTYGLALAEGRTDDANAAAAALVPVAAAAGSAGAAIVGAAFHYPTHAKLLLDSATSAGIDVQANIPNLVDPSTFAPDPQETTVGLTAATFLLGKITP